MTTTKGSEETHPPTTTQPYLPWDVEEMLVQARADPMTAVRDTRWRLGNHCLHFFRLCEEVAMDEPQRLPAFAQAAQQLSVFVDSPHVENRMLAVSAFLFMHQDLNDDAGQLFRRSRERATCCQSCRLDAEARIAAIGCSESGAWRQAANDDLRAAAALKAAGNKREALARAANALVTVPLRGSGYLAVEALSGFADVLVGAGPDDFKTCEGYLRRFKERIAEERQDDGVKPLLRWLYGLVKFHLMDDKSGCRMLNRVLALLWKAREKGEKVSLDLIVGVTVDRVRLFRDRMPSTCIGDQLEKCLELPLRHDVRDLIQKAAKHASRQERDDMVRALRQVRANIEAPLPDLLVDVHRV